MHLEFDPLQAALSRAFQSYGRPASLPLQIGADSRLMILTMITGIHRFLDHEIDILLDKYPGRRDALKKRYRLPADFKAKPSRCLPEKTMAHVTEYAVVQGHPDFDTQAHELFQTCERFRSRAFMCYSQIPGVDEYFGAVLSDRDHEKLELIRPVNRQFEYVIRMGVVRLCLMLFRRGTDYYDYCKGRIQGGAVPS